jgi:hypothetical protein
MNLPTPLESFPIGAISPEGWLLNQLRTQADGLTGHLDEIWPDVGPDSAWLGGKGEDWERGPYYLDGLIPLAFTLRSASLIAKAGMWVEAILGSQTNDGFFGPASNTDWWPRMVAVKALTQYFDATGDARVLDFLERYFGYQRSALDSRPLSDWGQARAAENVQAIQWLARRRPGADYTDLGAKLLSQSVDWESSLTRELITEPAREFNHCTHVVNVAMSFRSFVARAELDDPSAGEAFAAALERLDALHGLATGMFSGDEWLAGTAPEHGVELCAVVEFLHSLAEGFRVFGRAAWLDRLESVAYNMLAAHLSADLRSHQYHQQINQIACTIDRRNWTYSSDNANVFGLEPHFGCCTANLHQGWPKLVRSLWYRQGNGFISATLAPNTLTTTVEAVSVRIRVATDYPFAPSLRYQISTETPVHFALRLRLPGWCQQAKVQTSFGSDPVLNDGFAHFERTWRDGDEIEVELPFIPRVLARPRGAVCIAVGPLLLAYTPGEIWSRLPGSTGFGDFEVRARGSWNFGIQTRDIPKLVPIFQPVNNPPFQVQGTGREVSAPIRLPVTGRLLPEWTAVGASAGPVPTELTSRWPEHQIDLVPYGCTRIRIAEFPPLLTSTKNPTSEQTYV